jgi:hypothetical protein
MPSRCTVALTAGLRSAVGALFAVSALATVVAATHHDVHHHHPVGTPEHVHALGDVLGPVVDSEAVAAPTLAGVVGSASPTLRREAPVAPRPPVAWGERDPPTGT